MQSLPDPSERAAPPMPSVLLGPLRATTYMLVHGLFAATLGLCWKLRVNWWLSVLLGGLVRMGGQVMYLALTSLTMNENLFVVLLGNIYAMLVRQTSDGIPIITIGITAYPPD